VIGDDPNVIFKIGIGELPLAASGHLFDLARHRQHGGLRPRRRAACPRHPRGARRLLVPEELYARFRILGDAGTWGGASPLDRLERIPA
jgi:spheroidene monooxygenase